MVNRPLLALAVRIVIALGTWTFFQPDEYFQSLEVAHHAVFGYGQLTWEWLAPQPIRSIVYPALNIPIYLLLKWSKLDQTSALIWGPKLLHAIIAAATDIWLLRLTRRTVGERYVNTAFLISLTSFFHSLSLSRSLSNSAETSLTTIALSYFPWDPSRPSWRRELQGTVLFAALACAVRPTNAILWVYMFAWLLWELRGKLRDTVFVLVNGSVAGILVMLGIITLDSMYYGQLTVTPLNFLFTNASPVSLFYGSNPWHYYITQALPILTFPITTSFISGVYLATRPTSSGPSRVLLGLIGWTIFVYSLAGHKEWRFLHPVLPAMHILMAQELVDGSGSRNVDQRWRFGISHYFIPLSLPAILYVMLWHGRPQIEVMHYLRRLPPSQSSSIGFLMPCHSTPWQAYLHRPDLAEDGVLWALGCEPPLQGQNVSDYRDQTDFFYESPVRYLTTWFPQDVDPSFPTSPLPRSKPGVIAKDLYPWKHEWPQNLAFFGALLENEGVEGLLRRLGYEEVWQAQSLWEGDSRRKGGVRVWRYRAVD